MTCEERVKELELHSLKDKTDRANRSLCSQQTDKIRNKIGKKKKRQH